MTWKRANWFELGSRTRIKLWATAIDNNWALLTTDLLFLSCIFMIIILQSCLTTCEVSWWRNLFVTSSAFCKKYVLWSEVFWCEILPMMWSVFLRKTILNFLWSHFLWCEVFVLPLFRKVFLLGPLRTYFRFGILRATLAHVKVSVWCIGFICGICLTNPVDQLILKNCVGMLSLCRQEVESYDVQWKVMFDILVVLNKHLFYFCKEISSTDWLPKMIASIIFWNDTGFSY